MKMIKLVSFGCIVLLLLTYFSPHLFLAIYSVVWESEAINPMSNWVVEPLHVIYDLPEVAVLPFGQVDGLKILKSNTADYITYPWPGDYQVTDINGNVIANVSVGDRPITVPTVDFCSFYEIVFMCPQKPFDYKDFYTQLHSVGLDSLMTLSREKIKERYLAQVIYNDFLVDGQKSFVFTTPETTFVAKYKDNSGMVFVFPNGHDTYKFISFNTFNSVLPLDNNYIENAVFLVIDSLQ